MSRLLSARSQLVVANPDSDTRYRTSTLQQVASIEEITHHTYLGSFTAANVLSGAYTAAGTTATFLELPFMQVQMPCELRTLHLLVMTDVISNNTNFWTFGIRRQTSLNQPPTGPAATANQIVAPTTDVTTGKSMGASVPWSTMWRFWDFTQTTCGEDDLLVLRLTPSNSSAPPLDRLHIAWKVVPV